MKKEIIFLFFFFFFLLPCFVSAEAPPRPLVGAHYYSWFPENWKYGYLRGKLKPPVKPALGEYASASSDTFKKHVEQASSAGINFFIFDWWAKRPHHRRSLYRNVIKNNLLGDLQFAILYESHDLKEDGDRKIKGESENIVFMTEERSVRLRKHFEHFGKHYFRHPNYLRMNKKPVVFIYVSRHLVGPTAKAFLDMRAHIQKELGETLYLVGDEAYFNVLSYDEKKGIYMRAEYSPDKERIAAFDALTAYNPYDAGRQEHGGQEGAQHFLKDVSELYGEYQAHATRQGKRFIPTALPGYNDRGVRPKKKHFVVPRRLEAKNKTFFSESLRLWVKPYLDKTFPIFTVTSWNEWNEDTQIEPSAPSEKTRKDVSGKNRFTGGEEYLGYGRTHLDELKAFLDMLN